MANVSKILQTVGKGIKSAANSKAGKAVGKGTKKVVGTIFYPIKKAHQLQGANDFLNSTDKYAKGTSAGLCTFVATWAGAFGIGVAEATNNKNPENDNRNMIIFSTLFDAGSGCLSGLLLGGPIGAAIGLVAGAVVQKDLTIGLLDKEFAKDLDYARKELKEERVARKEARRAEKEQQKNTNNTPQQDVISDTTKTEVCDTIKADKDSTIYDIPKMVPGSSDFMPKIDTLQPVDTAYLADSVQIDTLQPVDTTHLADSVQDETSNADETKKDKETVIKQKEDNTNFWNGELNEIEVESIKVNKGDCLWNIAKRELQKANEGKRITNAQIVKQVKEFGRLNPELFGENPTYESLDFIREGATLKLSA